MSNGNRSITFNIRYNWYSLLQEILTSTMWIHRKVGKWGISNSFDITGRPQPEEPASICCTTHLIEQPSCVERWFNAIVTRSQYLYSILVPPNYKHPYLEVLILHSNAAFPEMGLANIGAETNTMRQSEEGFFDYSLT